ncbi:hypothetical protein MARPO_0106s0003 [Marchantia polymorpha]|uniref:F-box domain-containing protein n=1 Tax=Marchantia polymorpha TaxID=3197 RepID=A0A2R6WD75_MARPO|nr:hypothetical protein MARPO_0106s0003 [Marchantia polymorpha]|eukprot:PTQ31797.1 hypothetical protein MARPO_0106s0003 [Marchantia polymorpha]
MPAFRRVRTCFSAAYRCIGLDYAGGGGEDDRDRRSRKRARLADSLQQEKSTMAAAPITTTGIEVAEIDLYQRSLDSEHGFDIDDETVTEEEIRERSPEISTRTAAAHGEITNSPPFDPSQRVQEIVSQIDVKETGEGNSEAFNGRMVALEEIINHVPLEDKLRVVPLVCKAWRDASRSPASWRTVDLTTWTRDRWIRHDDRLSDEAQQSIIQHFLDLSGSQLREICITGGLCTIKSVEAIGLACSQLKSLTITNTSQLHDSSAIELAQRCRQLEALDLSDCYNISKETLKMFGTYNPSLTKLSRNMLRSLSLYDDNLRPPHGDEEALAIGTYMPGLKILELNTMTTLTDTGCSHIARNCHLLECLDLSGCFNVTADSLREIGMNCHALTKFARNLHNAFNDREYYENGNAEAGAIATHMVNLVSLELDVNLTDHGVREIALGCPKLVSFKPGARCRISQHLVHDLSSKFRLKIPNIKHARQWVS